MERLTRRTFLIGAVVIAVLRAPPSWARRKLRAVPPLINRVGVVFAPVVSRGGSAGVFPSYAEGYAV